MTRALTSPELIKLRGDQQWNRYYLAIQPRTVVFAARINQTFSSNDKVKAIKYDTATGDYTAVKPDMTVYIGSTPGAYDIGICRVRKAATSNKLFIGLISDIKLADNLHITVLNHYGWHPKHPTMRTDGSALMDCDVVYSAQHSATVPTVNLGAPTVAWLTGSSITVSFNASGSWNLSGGTLAFAWSFPGAVSSTGAATATPTATYNAAGTYQAACAITVAGVSKTRYTDVYVFSKTSMPVTQFEITALNGQFSDKGWGCDLTFYAEAGLSSLPDQAEIVIFSRDFYQGVEGSIGPISGRENIVFRGWVDDESLVSDPKSGKVSISAYGPQHWLDKIDAIPFDLKYGTNDWTHFSNLTVDAAIWQVLTWRSTTNNLIDIYPTGDTRAAPHLEGSEGTVWAQLKSILDRIMAEPICDHFGNLYNQIDSQYLADADRTSIPEVITLEKTDWRDGLDIQRLPTSESSQVILTGLVTSGASTKTIYSLAAGHIYKNFGAPFSKDGLLASSQSQQNALAGLILGHENRAYEFTIPGAAINRMIDIAPRQYILLNIAAGDTPRGVAYAGRAIVRSVSWDVVNGTLLPTYDAEMETFAEIGINGDIPILDDPDNPDDPNNSINVPMPSYPPIHNIETPEPPEPEPGLPDPANCNDTGPATTVNMAWDKAFLRGDGDRIAHTWNPCTIRSSTADNPTTMQFTINNRGQAYNHLHCYGIDGSYARLVSGIVTVSESSGDTYTMNVAFSPSTATTVAGFELELDEGLDATPAPLYCEIEGTDYRLDGPFEGGQTANVTLFRPIYDPTHGHIQFAFTGTGANNNGILNYNFQLSAHLSTEDGYEEFGDLYAYVIWSGISSAGPIAIESAGLGRKYTSYVGHYKVSEGFLAPIVSYYIISGDYFSPGNFTVGGFIDLYYSATIPQRSAALGPTNLNNVCPAGA